MDFGASKRGVSMGPLAIRHADIKSKISDMGLIYRDMGDIIPMTEGADNRNRNDGDMIVEANSRLFARVSESLKAGAFPVILGGDHSVAAGSIPAVAEYCGDIGLIWIDAHGDFNDDKSTKSGNMRSAYASKQLAKSELITYGFRVYRNCKASLKH